MQNLENNHKDGFKIRKGVGKIHLIQVDTNKIISNTFIFENLSEIKKSKFHDIKTLDYLPEIIQVQLKALTVDSFRVSKFNESLKMDELCSGNEQDFPCREIEYIGVSSNFILMSYLQACSNCKNYANNILLIKYTQEKIIDLWVGNFHPYVIPVYESNIYEFLNVNLTNPDTIFNYIDSELNKNKKLHDFPKLTI